MEGGTLYTSFQSNGGDVFYDRVGDFSGSSNISASHRDQIAELFYEQKLMNDRLRLKAGKIDVNGEFGVADNAGEFVNSTFAWSASFVGMPTYPDASYGGMVEFAPNDTYFVRAGVFDGAGAQGYRTGMRGVRTLFGDPSDLYYVLEAGANCSLCRDLPGTIKVGLFRHTGDFTRFDGSTANGVNGAYFIVDQCLFKEEPANDEDIQALSMFVRGAVTDRNVADVPWSIAAGVQWIGAVPGRDDDVCGCGVSYNGFTNASDAVRHGDEVVLELFYKAQLTHYFYVKPDVQYILSPSGVFDDAALVAVRAGIEF
ncbi:MAG: carbohydrate porin [Tepidisphaeraceae bacterium]